MIQTVHNDVDVLPMLFVLEQRRSNFWAFWPWQLTELECEIDTWGSSWQWAMGRHYYLCKNK
eukprot:scaffold77036_cov36-Cyclotella_meneghiniana.AAC.2